MRFKGPHKFAPLLSTADVSLVRPALMFREPRTVGSVGMVSNTEPIQKRRSSRCERKRPWPRPHFPHRDLNEAGRAADAARDVMEQ